MTRATIRPTLLRRYHEATYGDRPLTAEALEGVTFEEYVSLRRIHFPEMSAWRAAIEAPVAGFRARAKELDRDAREPPPQPIFATLARQPQVDLAAALEDIDPQVERLLLDRLVSVTGWTALRSLRSLDDLAVALCASTDRRAADPPIELRRLSLTECPTGIMRVVLRSTRAREIDIAYPQATVLDAVALASQHDAEDVALSAPLVHRVAHLAALPLRTLRLGRVEPDDELRQLLASLAPSLEVLRLATTRPFGPELLPDLPTLTRLQVPGTEETRGAWIDYALDHPEVGCRFPRFEPPPANEAAVTIHEIYRAVDILQATKGQKTSYEIALDLASEIEGFTGDNGDLEDQLAALAKGARKRGLKWSSEADTLVVRATKPETLRWLVDAAHGLRS